MPLFTDGPPSSIEDLSAQDSQLQEMANVEGINVTQKLMLAWDELGLQLYTLLNLSGTADQMLWQPVRPNLGAVVVTPSLKLWHTYRALEMAYADAYNCQLNDRYSGKRDQFHKQAQWAEGKLREIGIGIASLPVARAAKPMVSAVPTIGTPLADGTYYAAMAWVNRNGEEGACSEPADLTISGSTLFVQPPAAPPNAVSWNVYAGLDPNLLALQNGTLMAASESWVQPAPLVTGSRGPGNGQAANLLKAIPRAIQRG